MEDALLFSLPRFFFKPLYDFIFYLVTTAHARGVLKRGCSPSPTLDSLRYEVIVSGLTKTGVPLAAALKRDVVSRGQRSSAASLEAMTLWWPHYGYETLLPFEGFSRARLFRLLISVRLTPLVCMWLVGTGFARLRETSSTGP